MPVELFWNHPDGLLRLTQVYNTAGCDPLLADDRSLEVMGADLHPATVDYGTIFVGERFGLLTRNLVASCQRFAGTAEGLVE